MNLRQIFSFIFITYGLFVYTHITTAQVIPLLPKQGYRISGYSNIIPNDPKANKNVVLLTIDDGPSNQTASILKTLQKKDVSAIFFINGMNVKKHTGILQEEIRLGHSIGNHTWDHQNLKMLTDDAIVKEIEKNTERIFKETGTLPLFFRPPYGMSTKYSRDYVAKKSMMEMNWSTAAFDWEKSTKDKQIFIDNVLKNLGPGAIILIHEHPWSANALEDLIIAVRVRGYTFINPNQIVQ